MRAPENIDYRPGGPRDYPPVSGGRFAFSGLIPVIRKDAPLIRVIGVLSDGYLLAIVALVVYALFDPGLAEVTPLWKTVDAALFILVSLVSLYVFGLYEQAEQMRPLEILYRTLKSFVFATLIAFAVYYILGQDGLRGAPILLMSLFSFAAVSLWHGFGQGVLGFYAVPRPVLIVAGAGEEADELARELAGGAHPAYRLAGQVALDAPALSGETAELVQQVAELKSGLIAIPESINGHEAGGGLLLERISGPGREFVRISNLYEIVLGRVPLSQAVFLPALKRRRGTFYRLASRALDLTVSLAGILFMALILAPVAVAVKLSSPGPVFFRQERIGRQGKIFRLIKFRTMRIDPEGETVRLPVADDRRVTPAGRLLRRTHLDEVPQFINVLQGDLALVGPRPERPEVEELIRKKLPFFSLRHMARPGLTGWAQVMGGYPAGLEDMREKLQYDLFYIKNRCFFLDLVILFKTVKAVFQLKGR